MKIIVILCLLAIVAYLVALYNGKIKDENKNYTPDEAEEVYFSFKKYLGEVKAGVKQLINIVLKKDA